MWRAGVFDFSQSLDEWARTRQWIKQTLKHAATADEREPQHQT